MTDRDIKPRTGRGTVPRPAHLEILDERERAEDAAVAELDGRLARGETTADEADREIVELALKRFPFLPAEIVQELRRVGLELMEEPEMVETRRLAPGPRRGTER